MKNEGNIDFWATTRVAPTKYRRRHNQSGIEMSRRFKGVCNTPLQFNGIINMNGRIYDPIVGQFMQADNYIQSPEDFISYNRYAYCLYNPFKYTDPSGEEYLGEGEGDDDDPSTWPITSAGGPIVDTPDDPIDITPPPSCPSDENPVIDDEIEFLHNRFNNGYCVKTVPSQIANNVAGGTGKASNNSGCGVIISIDLCKALNTKANISGGKEAFVLGAIIPVYGDNPVTWGHVIGFNLVYTDINIGTKDDRYGNLNILDAINKDGRFSLNNVYSQFHTHTEGSFSNGDMESMAINTFNNYKDPELAINLTRNGFVNGVVSSNYIELLVVNSSDTYANWYKNEMGKYDEAHPNRRGKYPRWHFINIIKNNNNGSSGLYYYKFKW